MKLGGLYGQWVGAGIQKDLCEASGLPGSHLGQQGGWGGGTHSASFMARGDTLDESAGHWAGTTENVGDIAS